MPREQRPDKTVAGSSKRHASRFYQLKTGHCLAGQYLNWTKSRPTAQCWWCPCRTQTREHCLKACPVWKAQQKTGQEGDREVEEPLEGAGPISGREMQQGGTRLPLHHGCREASPVPG